MAHRINVEDGQASMMYFGEEPWHGLGTELSKPATAAEAMTAAKLDWTVRKVPLYAWGGKVAYPMADLFAVVPERLWGTAQCPTWGPVGPYYTPLQNREAFDFFDPIVGDGGAIYHTAGALDEGRRIWLLAKLPTDITVATGDITKKYLLLSNSHDGTGSVQIKFTPIRVVCHNTLTIALQTGDKTTRVPHTRDIKDRLDTARRSLKLINTAYDQIAKDFAAMARVAIDDERLSEYLARVLPAPEKSKEPREFDRVQRERAQAARLFVNGKGNDLAGVAGSLWAAYNGITEMVDQGRNRRTPEQHLEHIWFGGGAGLKGRAFETAKVLMADWK